MIKVISIGCVTLYIAIVSQIFLGSTLSRSTVSPSWAEVSASSDPADTSSLSGNEERVLSLEHYCEELPLDYCQTGLALLSGACPASDSIAIEISTAAKSSWIPVQMFCDSPNPGIFYFDHDCKPWTWTIFKYRGGEVVQRAKGTVHP